MSYRFLFSFLTHVDDLTSFNVPFRNGPATFFSTQAEEEAKKAAEAGDKEAALKKLEALKREEEERARRCVFFCGRIITVD